MVGGGRGCCFCGHGPCFAGTTQGEWPFLPFWPTALFLRQPERQYALVLIPGKLTRLSWSSGVCDYKASGSEAGVHAIVSESGGGSSSTPTTVPIGTSIQCT